MSDFHITKPGREVKWLIYRVHKSWAVHAPLTGWERKPMAEAALLDTHTECVAYMLNNDPRRIMHPTVTVGLLNASSDLAAEGFCPPLAGDRPPF